MTENGMLPSNWRTFIGCSKNKKELLPFLSKKTVKKLHDYKIVVAAADENVISNQSLYSDYIMPCNIEEADERMFLNVNNAANQFSKHLIKTVDSDIIAISVTVFDQLQSVDELWIELGRGKTFQNISVYEITKGFGIVGS